MYSRKSVELGLKVAEEDLGYELVYHSVEACDEAAAHFDDKLQRYKEQYGEPPYTPSTPRMLFTREEVKWIENEKYLSQVDYLYFATRYAKILAKSEVIHYSPNIAQLVVNDARSELEDMGWAIMMMWLKGRQCGITTDSQVVIGHRTLFFPNVIALTGSSDKERSKDMVDKYKQLYDWIPYWLKPEMTRDRMGTRMEFGELNSKLIVQHGAQKYDIGRGNTPDCVHLSEVASYLNAEDLIDAGLVPAVHEDPSKIVILESTGEGPYGWWYKTWNRCKSHYWQGEAKFRPGFLPWFVAFNFYPTPTQLKRSFKLEMSTEDPAAVHEAVRLKLKERGWHPNGETIGHASRAKKFVRADKLLRRHYPENWEMPLEQMWFWQITKEDYASKKDTARFLREFASDDLESFIASGESVFDVDTLSSYNTHCQEPLGVFGFRGPIHLLPARLQADEHDRDTTRKIIDVGPYQMVPLKWPGWQTGDPTGKLMVFQWPRYGETYGFGVDTGDGVGQDRTVLEGLCKGTFEHNDIQVCEFASEYINAADFVSICHCVGLFYQGASHQQPRMAIEVNFNGEITQLELRKRGWANFHNWVRTDRKKIDPSTATRLGFVTNRWSRAMVIDYTIKALRDGEIDINSPRFVEEMQALHRDEGMQAARAESGQHDDRYMALGIIWVSLHIMEISGKAQSISYLRKQREQEASPMYREVLGGDDYAPPTVSPQQLANGGAPALRETFAGAAVSVHPGAMGASWEDEG
jgi:hypothetical protein